MGTISFQVTTAQGQVSKSYTVADNDIVRVIAAHQDQANTSVNGTATRGQVLQYIFGAWVDLIKNRTKGHEREAAVKAISVPDIAAT